MTFAELRSLVWYYVDDSQGISTGTGGYFTNTQVNVFLNNAQKEVQKQLLQAGEMYYLKTVETTTVANQQDYILPSDFLKLHRLEYVVSGSTAITEDTKMMQRLTLNQSDMFSVKVGMPSAYTIKKNRFSLYPIPDTASKTLRLFYSYRVADMSGNTDEPDVVGEFIEYIAILAAETCMIKDDRSSAALMEKKQSYLNLLKQMAEDRAQDSSREVINTYEDGYGDMF
jgi:hypothetical protein